MSKVEGVGDRFGDYMLGIAPFCPTQVDRVKFTRPNTQIVKYSDVSEVRQRIAKPNPIRAPTWDALPLQTDMPSFSLPSHSPFAKYAALLSILPAAKHPKLVIDYQQFVSK